MKRSLKDRINALGLSYQKEMMFLILLIVIVIALAFITYIFVKQIYFPLFIVGGGAIAVYFYLSRYSSLERKQEKEHVDQLISLLSYFEIFISNGRKRNTFASPVEINDTIYFQLYQLGKWKEQK